MERGLNAARGGEPGRRRSRPALGGQLREPQVCAPPVRVGGGLLCVESPHGALQAVGPQRLVPGFILCCFGRSPSKWWSQLCWHAAPRVRTCPRTAGPPGDQGRRVWRDGGQGADRGAPGLTGPPRLPLPASSADHLAGPRLLFRVLHRFSLKPLRGNS